MVSLLSSLFETRSLAKWSAAIVCLLICLVTSDVSAQPPGSGWRLHFCDEFSGDQIDALKWQTKYPWGRTHNHQAYMRDSNVVVGDGVCTLRAIRESFSGKPFTSGIISTGYSKYTCRHGYVEARILLPNRPGSWPAFWGLYTGWPPENDIMEYPIDTASGNGYPQSDYHTAFHYSTGGGGNAAGGGSVNPSSAGDLGNGWHVFGMEWVEDDVVRWYFDGQEVRSFGNNSAIAQMESMYLILNYAVGGWPGTPNQTEWPEGAMDETLIDWVRVWQKPDDIGSASYTFNSSSTGSWSGDENWNSFEPQHSRQIANFNTLAGRTNMQVGWNQLKTIGEVYIDGTTVYEIGDNDGDLDSLMFADEGDGWARLWVDGGVGGHSINSRIEIRNRLSVRNYGENPLQFHGDILGHLRDEAPTATARIFFKGTGTTVVNGTGYYQGTTDLSEQANVILDDQIYAGRVVPETHLLISAASRLSLDNLSSGGSLGNLPTESNRIILNNGTLNLRNTSVADHSFQIDSLGGTIEVVADQFVQFVPDENIQIAGALDLSGDGGGNIWSVIESNGSIRKSGNGTWVLSGSNVYSGTTTVQSGNLHINGTTGIGLTTVQSGAVIEGGGSVRGDLNNLGAVRPSGEFEDDDSSLGFLRITDFESGVDVWETTGNPNFGVVNDPIDSSNQVARLGGGSGGDDIAYLPLSASQINGNSNLATVYFRFLAEPGNAGDPFEVYFGLGQDGDVSPDSLTDYSVQTGVRDEFIQGAAFENYLTFQNGAFNFTSDEDFWQPDQWVEVWYVIDAHANTYDMHVDHGNGQQLVADDFEFRTDGDNIDSFFLTSGDQMDVLEKIYIDDLYVDQNNQNLGRPGDNSQDYEPIGRLVVDGDYEQTSSGELEIEIAAAEQSDLLFVSGEAAIEGTLSINLRDGYQPTDGDLFLVVHSLSMIEGTFTTIEVSPELQGIEPEIFQTDRSIFVLFTAGEVLLGDVNLDGNVNLLDVAPFVSLVSQNLFQEEADVNQDGVVNLLDIGPFVQLLGG